MPKRRAAAAAAAEQSESSQGHAADKEPTQTEPGPHSLWHIELPFKSKKPFHSKFAKRKRTRTLRAVVHQLMQERWPPNAPIYTSIQAPVNLGPQCKYCDLTGLKARYTDPRTRLRYFGTAQFKELREASRAQVMDLLQLRGSTVQHVEML